MLFIEEKIDGIAAEARAFIEQGEYKKAERIARQLDKSPYIEGWVHAKKLLALTSIARGNPARAKELVRQAMANSWCDIELMKIFRVGNAPVSDSCKHFRITLRAGGPIDSPLCMFNPTYQVTFYVIGRDDSDAIRLLKDYLNIDRDFPILVLDYEILNMPEKVDCCGVYWSTPFERRTKKKLSVKHSAHLQVQ